MAQAKTEQLEYWLIAIPNQGNRNKTVDALKSNVEYRGGEHYSLNKLPITRLKVGTLDKLIALSDDLGRIDASGRNVVQKLHRSYAELEENTDQLLSVYNKSIRGYITNFIWDEGHFNPRAQLRDLVQVIHSNMIKTAEHLRKWSSSLSEIQNELNAIERKKTGSLMNKSLNQFINRDDWHCGEYITSALVVVPNSKCAEFIEKYEFFEDTPAHKAYYAQLNNKDNDDENGDDDDNEEEIKCRIVVPNSYKFITKDREFSLFRVLLLRRGYAWFKYVAMKNGYAVRDFVLNIGDEQSPINDEKIANDLQKKELSQKKKLKLFCKNTFSETFANWMHLKIIRCFVESVLRFGLPVDFSVSVVKPVGGKEKQLLKFLEQKYSFLLDKILKDKHVGSEETEIDYSGQLNDFYPFVFISMKIEL